MWGESAEDVWQVDVQGERFVGASVQWNRKSFPAW